MSDYYAFEGMIVAMEWGTSTYTVLPVPQEVAEALAREGATRVEGEINDHPVNLALTTAPAIDGVFLWTGKSLLDSARIGPGEVLDVRLRKADASVVETPVDVLAALREAGVMAEWQALTPGKQRGHLHQINSAKRAETRAKRITKLAASIGVSADG